MVTFRIVEQQGGPGFFSVRLHIDERMFPKVVTLIDEADAMEARLARHLENYNYAPHMTRGEEAFTVEYLANRGCDLSRSALLQDGLSATGPAADEGWHIEIVGSGEVLHQAWELMQLSPESPPLALTIPIIRVLPGTNTYAHVGPTHGKTRVLVLTSRGNHRTERLPRAVTGPIVQSAAVENSQLEVECLTPADPNRLAALYRRTGDDDPVAHILHVDSHSRSIDARAFANLDQALQARFETALDLPRLGSFSGYRTFVLLDWGEGDVALSGEQIAVIAQRLGSTAVVLSVCRAAADNMGTSLATEIIHAGVPDVIAVRHNLTERGAALMSTGFYAALATGCDVRASVCNARKMMYENRFRKVGNQVIEIHDWISVLHYQSADSTRAGLDPREAPNAFETAQAALQTWRPLSPMTERSIYAAQQEVMRGWKSQEPAPILFAGTLGLAAEATAELAANWICATNRWFGQLVRVNATEFLLLSGKDLQNRCADTAAFLANTYGSTALVLIEGASTLTPHDYTQRGALQTLLSLLSIYGLQSIVAVDEPVLLLKSIPVSICVVFLHTLDLPSRLELGSRREDGFKDKALREALLWIAGAFPEFAEAICKLDNHELIATLNYLVLGGSCPIGFHASIGGQLAIVVKRSKLSGSLRFPRRRRPRPVHLLVCMLGSGVTDFDINRGPCKTDDLVSHYFEVFRLAGLGCYIDPAGWPTDWRENGCRAVFINPLLRPYWRVKLGYRQRYQLDRAAFEYATLKLSSLNNTVNMYGHAVAEAYFEHSRPFLISALWLARHYGWNTTSLVMEIHRAMMLHLWPESLEPTILLGDRPISKASDSVIEHAFSKNLEAAVRLRDSGNFKEALSSIETALSEASSMPQRALGLLVKGTILVDIEKLSDADNALSEAEGLVRKQGPREMLAEIVFERANLLYQDSVVTGREPKNAQARYREALQLAMDGGPRRHDLACRCYANLAAIELTLVPLAPPISRMPDDLLPSVSRAFYQARDYVRRAERCARRGGSAARWSGLFALRARIAMASAKQSSALELIKKSIDAAKENGSAKDLEIAKHLEIQISQVMER
jgi:tetratricopeptide (TPR) repeat protein